MKKNLFVPEIEAEDPIYRRLRDDEICREAREKIENRFSLFSPYADRDFSKRIAKAFLSHNWELELGCTLLECGYKLHPQRKKQGRPDFQFEVENRMVWIEAICPDRGRGADAIKDPLENEDNKTDNAFVFKVEQDKIVLRIRYGIWQKDDKGKRYREQGIIRSGEPYIIAVNGCKWPGVRSNFGVPYGVRAVLPVGGVGFTVGESLDDSEGRSFLIREEAINKANDVEIRTDIFCDPSYSHISGLIWSKTEPAYTGELGSDFVYIHNPLAENPMPKGWLPRGIEFYEGEKMKVRVYCGAQKWDFLGNR